MKISFNEMDEILRTLPIGYYAKKRIPTKLDHAETSYFDVVNKAITVSYEGVNIALANVPEEDMEMAVRSSLYHEVSHALLTSTNLFTDTRRWYNRRTITPEFNIFEDERIETACEGVYLNTDFIKNRYLINGLVPFAPLPKPNNAESAFYHLVRFHEGTQYWLDKVQKLLDSYLNLNITSDEWDWCWYYDKVEELYEEFCKDYNADPENYQNNSIPSPYQSDLEGTPQNGEGQNGEKGQGVATDLANSENGEGEAKAEQCDEKGEPGGRSGGWGEMFENLYNELAERYTLDPKTAQQLEMILSNFNKKNGGGASITAYSGRLNPRQMIRDEYKIFERKSSIRGSNTYGSLHLNLFIDVSGSFYYNKDEVNRLLICLQNLEKRYSYFSFDLVKCGVGEILADKDKRLINPDGGNRLTENVVSLFRQLQKPQTQNCNIMLFDGDCCPDRGVFNKLDNSSLTIIAETDNMRYLKSMEKAKVIYENNNYADMLTDNVLKVIARGFK